GDTPDTKSSTVCPDPRNPTTPGDSPALSRFVGGDQRLTPIMNAAGLSVAGWYEAVLSGSEGP
ncbi:hypothetical protein, partial [Mycolicibacter sinensis]|uniref:hypothetical protein n=1 Tax=Mycolicibacter sinensis (strain JDM601) TaxID=875328 RepID=UPI000A4069D6